jgi:hypothetical protein
MKIKPYLIWKLKEIWLLDLGSDITTLNHGTTEQIPSLKKKKLRGKTVT